MKSQNNVRIHSQIPVLNDSAVVVWRAKVRVSGLVSGIDVLYSRAGYSEVLDPEPASSFGLDKHSGDYVLCRRVVVYRFQRQPFARMFCYT